MLFGLETDFATTLPDEPEADGAPLESLKKHMLEGLSIEAMLKKYCEYRTTPAAMSHEVTKFMTQACRLAGRAGASKGTQCVLLDKACARVGLLDESTNDLIVCAARDAASATKEDAAIGTFLGGIADMFKLTSVADIMRTSPPPLAPALEAKRREFFSTHGKLSVFYHLGMACGAPTPTYVTPASLSSLSLRRAMGQ